jgi:hypothetical protein
MDGMADLTASLTTFEQDCPRCFAESFLTKKVVKSAKPLSKPLFYKEILVKILTAVCISGVLAK